MARIEHTGAGGARRPSRGNGASGGTAHSKRKGKRHVSAKQHHPGRHTATPAASTTPRAEPITPHSAWSHTPPTGAATPLVALDPTHAASPDPLTLAGAGAASQHAWARDHALSRATRRPGGLARMAGL